MPLKILILLLSLFCLTSSSVFAKTPIRLGVMAGGTLAWELAALKNLDLPEKTDFEIETITLADQQAGKIALLSGSVDIIISDWIWVSGMRSQGGDYSFYPYSTAAGGLLVTADSPIQTLADLEGKKLGIAGGELDKNWLMLQTLGLKQNLDFNKPQNIVYAAPPLLNQQLAEQRIDALLTYWQFAARLQAQGYRELLSGEQIIRELGITEAVPSLGYAFRAGWAEEHKAALLSFFKAADTARESLCSNEQAWDSIKPLTQAEAAEVQQHLRKRYCEGRITAWGEANRKAADQLYQLLHQLHNNKLTAKNPHLEDGTFWQAN